MFPVYMSFRKFFVQKRCRSTWLSLKHLYQTAIIPRISQQSFSTAKQSGPDQNSGVVEKFTLSYCHGGSPSSLIGETIPQRMKKVAEKYPDKEFAVFLEDGKRLTFSQFYEYACAVGKGLMALGLRKGDRVGIWGPNCLEWILIQYATAMTGMIMVNINPSYKSNELEYALEKTGCRGLVMTPGFKTTNYYEVLSSLVPEMRTTSNDGKITSSRFPNLKHVILTEGETQRGTISFEELAYSGGKEEHEALECLQTSLCFDEPINIQFTSGTTGRPKGATLTHHNIMNNAYFLSRTLKYFQPDTKICIPVPLYHCFGMVLGSLAAMICGATAVFPSRSFNADLALQAIDTEKCTSVYGTPTMFIDMLNSSRFSEFDLASLRTGVMAGSQCPEEIMKQVINNMNCREISIVYGQTEASPITNITHHSDPFDKRVTTVGKPFPFVEVKVVDKERKVVPVYTKGEIAFRGHGIMLGYWEEEEKTRESLDDFGWLYSGDLGIMDDQGYFHIIGRTKDMIIRGGENIYPKEIEEFLHGHPKIRDVQVIGVPDKRLGEDVCAWIRLREGTKMTPEEVRDFCRENMAYFKIPKYIKFVDEYPLTVTGKVKKYEMREIMSKELSITL
ncbi:medium-chain acyl-CoA ligase ACSF2, mitochondrial-like [Rhopilema esculentum]|uniref:medium-chain acyl-CoA ligase ACSF2, mitochondrial-like n=1 Tax=Rhopilema esculentum TaxID=499914 RepID=UPI0031E1B78A|eukprot:gene2883-1120_t